VLAPWSVACTFDLMVPTGCASSCNTPSVLCWRLRVAMHTGNGYLPSPRLCHWCVRVHFWLQGSPGPLKSCAGLRPSSQRLLAACAQAVSAGLPTVHAREPMAYLVLRALAEMTEAASARRERYSHDSVPGGQSAQREAGDVAL
jgi:hypothetical protein